MMGGIHKLALLTMVVATCVFVVVLSAKVADAFIPSKFVLSSHLGWKVDHTTGGTMCTTISQDECLPGELSGEAGGFRYPESVAVGPSGNVYVADQGNHRVQEFTPTGEFVLMFGFTVNNKGGNVCATVEEGECQAGSPGSGGPDQLSEPQDVAVDSGTGNVYVLDLAYHRVDEYTENGVFILMIGSKVNKTRVEAIEAKGGTPTASEVEEENVCTAEEVNNSGAVCQAGMESLPASAVPGAFKPHEFYGSLLAVGPEDHLLYVGDEARVQEFHSSGKSAGQITTKARTVGLAVDRASDVFVAEEGVAGVHEYKANVIQPCVVDSNATEVQGLAIDAYDRLGVIEGTPGVFYDKHGAVYQTSGAECGTKVAGSEFSLPALSTSLAFNISKPAEPLTDRLYISEEGCCGVPQEVEVWAPVVFPEVRECPAREIATTSTTLCGEIDSNGVPTKGFFTYGSKEHELVYQTPVVFEGEGENFQSVTSSIQGLTPNEIYWYRTVAEAKVEGRQERAGGKELSFHTSTLAPETPGAPFASFVKGRTAVLSALLNPEHAPTHYYFEYGPCPTLEGCSPIETTKDDASSRYQLIGVTQEATGLAPQTTYSVRLVADNRFEFAGLPEGAEVRGEEGHFTTAAVAPQAVTGAYGGVTSTSAVISGEVNPDSEPGIYRFELGVYNPAEPSYGVVFSGATGAGTTPVDETLQLSGLQPTTTYAYRIMIENAVESSYGAPLTFTTDATGVPSLSGSLAMLPAPTVEFPSQLGGKPRCKRGYRLGGHHKCTKRRRTSVKRTKGTGHHVRRSGARMTRKIGN
jgi:hypothetical protein